MWGWMADYHRHICFCYYWLNKLCWQFICTVVRVTESNYPMLRKWLCTKRNTSPIHKAINAVRQSYNGVTLHTNSSKLPGLKKLLKSRSSNGRSGESSNVKDAELEWDCSGCCIKTPHQRSCVKEHSYKWKCEMRLQRRTISNMPYQLKVRERC